MTLQEDIAPTNVIIVKLKMTLNAKAKREKLANPFLNIPFRTMETYAEHTIEITYFFVV